MSFGFSVGDIITCGQLAWSLGQLFTSGRRGAPAKYREVENQLYALSRSLDHLGDAVRRGEIAMVQSGSQPMQSAQGLESMKLMLNNCKDTLVGLQRITDKYSEPLSSTVVASYSSTTTYSTTRKWRKKIVQNWYKVWWSTEGDDIKNLMSNLVVHTNSINLMVGTITSQTSTRILDNVEIFAPKIDRMMNMFEEIYRWHERDLHAATEAQTIRPSIANFQPAPPYTATAEIPVVFYEEQAIPPPPPPPPPSRPSPRIPPPLPKKAKPRNVLDAPKARPGYLNDSTGSLASTISSSKRKSRAGEHDITFDVCVQTESSSTCLCPNASLHGAWTTCEDPEENEEGMFVCLCDNSEEGEVEPHAECLKGFYLSEATLAVRYSGQTKWALHRTVRYAWSEKTEKQKQEMVTLSMQVQNPSHESKFERIFVEPLALRTAKASLKDSSVPPELAHKVYSDKRVAILNCKSDSANFSDSIESISFILAGDSRRVKVNKVTHAEILHYKTMNTDSVRHSNELWKDAPKYEETAEMIFRFAKTEDYRSLNLYASETDLSNISESDEGDKHVISLPNIKIGRASVPNPKKGFDYRISGKVTFKFKTSETTMAFVDRIEDMQKELRALKIQFPRRSEKIMLKLFAGDICAGKFKMANAEITVVYNPNSKMGRVLVKAGDGSAYLSQNLNPGFFNKFSELSKGTLFLGSAEYLDNVGMKEITKFPQGVGSIQFENEDMDQLFFDRLTEAAEQFGFYQKSELPDEVEETTVSRDETPIVRWSIRPDFKFNLQEVEASATPPQQDLSRPMDAEELFTLFNQSSKKDQSERIQPWTMTETVALDAPPDIADDFPYMRSDFHFPLQPSMPAERSLEDIMRPKKWRRSFSEGSLKEAALEAEEGLEISRVQSHDHYLRPDHYHHHHYPERLSKSNPPTPRIGVLEKPELEKPETEKQEATKSESPTLGATEKEEPEVTVEPPDTNGVKGSSEPPKFALRPTEVSMAVFDSILKFKDKANHKRSKSLNPPPKPDDLDQPADLPAIDIPQDVPDTETLDGSKTPDVENVAQDVPKPVSLSSSFIVEPLVGLELNPTPPPTSPPLPLISSKENLKELVMDVSVEKTRAFRVLDDSYEPDMYKDTLVWIEEQVDTLDSKKKYWATDVSGENTCWIRGTSLREEKYYRIQETVKSQDRSRPVRLLKGESVVVLEEGDDVPEAPWKVVHLGGKEGDIAVVPRRVFTEVERPN